MGDTEIVRKDEEPNKPNPIFSLFTKFTQSFNFPPPKKVAEKPETAVLETKSLEPAAGAGEGDSKRPVAVKLPNRQAVPPLKLEAEELEQDTNPVVLWQVYAIGGFFILKWAWARWNEWRANKKSSDEDPPPADD